MKVGLIGFGKTGKAVASILLESKHVTLQWVLRRSNVLEHRSVPEYLGIDSDEPGTIYSKNEYSAAELLDKFPVEVIVDFSSEEGIEYYASEAQKRGISIVSAVSAYSDKKLALIKKISKATKILHSPNITLGVNFLILASKVLRKIAPHTDIEIIEEHFRKKPETSGTAKIIASGLDLPETAIKSVRAGGIIGVHEIIFGFPHQTVRLKHESISREAFGNGVLFAILNLPKKNRGLFTMEDLLMPHFQPDGPASAWMSGKTPWWQFWRRG